MGSETERPLRPRADDRGAPETVWEFLVDPEKARVEGGSKRRSSRRREAHTG